MAKFFFACFRDPAASGFNRAFLSRLAAQLQPAIIDYPEPKIHIGDGSCYVIANPGESIKADDASVCLGAIDRYSADYNRPGGQVPDGSYALFRWNPDHVELVTDMLANRTIWYYQDERFFLASTSQRALVFALGSFRFNDATLPWYLANGLLGPGNSWDERFRMVPADSTVNLDRHSWQLQVQRCEPDFTEIHRSDEDHARELSNAISASVAELELPPGTMLLLSGGRDSRGIIAHLQDRSIPCVTWGLSRRRGNIHGDGYIAAQLARHYGHPHEYLNTDADDAGPREVIERFVASGEGRADRLVGYTDGFELWKNLFEKNMQLALRGDVAFGFKVAATELKMREVLGLRSLLDFANLPEPDQLGLNDPAWPSWMQRRPGETLARWRDRLHYGYRHPVFLAALHEPKLSFTEVASPLLNRRILTVVQSLPDRLRSDKGLYRRVVNRAAPDVPFATDSATPSMAEILRGGPYREQMRDELEQACAVLPDPVVSFLLRKLEKAVDDPRDGHVRRAVRVLVPKKLRRMVPLTLQPKMNFNIMAFRATIISATHRMLEADAKAGKAASEARDSAP